MTTTCRVLAALAGSLCFSVAPATPPQAQGQRLSEMERAMIGHSAHGAAFDEGPRQRPWRMEGIGRTHFPITTSVPEVQEWFDQGHTLLHSYWFYEAERAFRWCLKLDPECAMAYWGLYRTTPGTNPALPEPDRQRALDFLREASRRKDSVSERERMYIEAWEATVTSNAPVLYLEGVSGRHAEFRKRLERIILKYPEDVEAKALYANENLGSYTVGLASINNRYGNELVLQQVLAVNPDHPGAHHYRIHNWDGPEGWVALDSSAAYGRVAPNVGHARHMPGHVYASQGMWHEAAISMDSATRVERAYMRQRMTLPFNDWNYAHNLNYLCYFLEQLGMPGVALATAAQLLDAPLDPKFNDPDNLATTPPFREGMVATLRALIHFERWEQVLEPGSIPWRRTLLDELWRAYAEALAYLGRGNVTEAQARLDQLKRAWARIAASGSVELIAKPYEIQWREVEGLIALARNDLLTGLKLLSEAADLEFDLRDVANDPPLYPRLVSNVLGEAYLEQGSPRLAVAAFERGLEHVPNDPMALAGLVQAHAALGETAQARECYARLLHVWSNAEAGLRWLEAAASLGLQARPRDLSPGTQRGYRSMVLDQIGPSLWEPYPAPELKAFDSRQQAVTLEEYRGSNVLLVFYLGEECPHCMEQLAAIKKRFNEFSLQGAEILAISSRPPQENAASEALGGLGFPLLSDADHSNARRFHSYDDFEEMELHSTIVIDGAGRVRWTRTGGDPFMDIDFLLEEIKRVNATPVLASTGPGGR